MAFRKTQGHQTQTFDDWPLPGVSAYCGGLWLAALSAAVAIGEMVGDAATIAEYQTWLEQGKEIYQEKLWNGEFYQLDSESGSDVVMADQLCGQFYAQLLGLPDIVPRSRTQSALKKIYEACFVKFNQQHSEKLGVANGVRLRCAHATAN